MEDIAGHFAAYLQNKMPNATDFLVTSTRLRGGTSRETYRVEAKWKVDGKTCGRAMVLRREAQGGPVDTQSDTEYRAYEAFFRAGLPVPEPLFLELDPKWLERPFMVAAAIQNCRTAAVWSLEPFGEHAETVGEQFYTYLGMIAAQDPEKLGLVGALENVAPEECWQRELKRWETVVEKDAVSPEPIVRIAIRWLRHNPPPPAQKICVVHGDCNPGNVLFNDKGEIKAILDWELAHLGDPFEDLGWATDRIWTFRQPNRVGGMIDREKAFHIWEHASGLKINPAALRWWQLLIEVKLFAISITVGRNQHDGTSTSHAPIVGGWYNTLELSEQIAGTLLAAECENML